jgi:uncharacterized OsmC-like protein
MVTINGVDIEKTKETIERLKVDPSLADRQPVIKAKWEGSGSLTTIKLDEKTAKIGGADNLNAMQTLLASLAACDIDLIATHAALEGIKIDELSIEATGHFNSRAYYGVEDAPGPGYDDIEYKVHIKAPGISSNQIKYLEKVCGRSSPVGDSLAKAIPLKLSIKSN